MEDHQMTAVIDGNEIIPMQTSSPKINFTVQTITGKLIQLAVINTTSVENLKSIIQDQVGIPPDQQALSFNNEKMNDNYSIDHYNICNGSIVHLGLRLRGGCSLEWMESFRAQTGTQTQTFSRQDYQSQPISISSQSQITIFLSMYQEVQPALSIASSTYPLMTFYAGTVPIPLPSQRYEPALHAVIVDFTNVPILRDGKYYMRPSQAILPNENGAGITFIGA